MKATTQQRELIACLARRSAKLAKIYEGGLLVLCNEENPQRFELAAHSMRELIEKNSLLTNGDAWAQGDGMKNRLVQVRRTYDAVQRRGVGGEALEDSRDEVQALVRELGRFFEWQDTNRQEMKKRIAQTLSALSGPGQPLPVDVWENEVGQWLAAHGYFNLVAHNRYDSIDREIFFRHMDLIEQVLLSRLQPPAVADLDAIDALIAEGENGHR